MKICFICHANICRSFISQEILKCLLQKDNRTDIEVISRGTYALDYLIVPQKIKDFLAEKDYGKTTVHVNTTDEDTQIKINANLKSDDVVAQLSTDISSFLLEE